MTITISKDKSARGLLKQVQEISGADLSKCYQCKKCTSGCPVSGMAKCPPSELMRRLHLGLGDELLNSDILWMCVSCETCSARCPMGIDVAAVMDALRKLAVQRGAARPEGNVPLFNRAFLKTVQVFGRTYDLAMIAGYKLGSGTLLADTEKFPTMLTKRKIALLPPRGADRRTVRRIFKKTEEVAPSPSGVKNKVGQ
jgi:heterodisulfide reductase subunit C